MERSIPIHYKSGPGLIPSIFFLPLAYIKGWSLGLLIGAVMNSAKLFKDKTWHNRGKKYQPIHRIVRFQFGRTLRGSHRFGKWFLNFHMGAWLLGAIRGYEDPANIPLGCGFMVLVRRARKRGHNWFFPIRKRAYRHSFFAGTFNYRRWQRGWRRRMINSMLFFTIIESVMSFWGSQTRVQYPVNTLLWGGHQAFQIYNPDENDLLREMIEVGRYIPGREGVQDGISPSKDYGSGLNTEIELP